MNKRVICTLVWAVVITACHNNAANQQLGAGKAALQEQIETITKQLAQKPDSVGLRWHLVNSLDSIGNYQLALQQMDSLIKKDTMNYGLWFKKAQVLEHAGDTAKAITNYSVAANIYASPDVLLALANLYAETKNANLLLVCKQLNNMGLGRQYDAYISFFTGVYYARLGNKALALEWLDQSITQNFTLADAYMEKGYLLYDAKQYTDALKVFITLNNVNTTYADGYYWQGKCLEAANKKAEAKEKYTTALQLNANLKEAAAAINRLN